MDLFEYDVPELEGDLSSRYTHSIVSVSSREWRRIYNKGHDRADIHGRRPSLGSENASRPSVE